MDRKIYPDYLGEIFVAGESSSFEKQLVQQRIILSAISMTSRWSGKKPAGYNKS